LLLNNNMTLQIINNRVTDKHINYSIFCEGAIKKIFLAFLRMNSNSYVINYYAHER